MLYEGAAKVPVASERPKGPFDGASSSGNKLAGIIITCFGSIRGRSLSEGVDKNKVFMVVIGVFVFAANSDAFRADDRAVFLYESIHQAHCFSQRYGNSL